MPDVVPGDYFGPAGAGEVRGTPTRVGMSARARDAVVGAPPLATSARS